MSLRLRGRPGSRSWGRLWMAVGCFLAATSATAVLAAASEAPAPAASCTGTVLAGCTATGSGGGLGAGVSVGGTAATSITGSGLSAVVCLVQCAGLGVTLGTPCPTAAGSCSPLGVGAPAVQQPGSASPTPTPTQDPGTCIAALGVCVGGSGCTVSANGQCAVPPVQPTPTPRTPTPSPGRHPTPPPRPTPTPRATPTAAPPPALTGAAGGGPAASPPGPFGTQVGPAVLDTGAPAAPQGFDSLRAFSFGGAPLLWPLFILADLIALLAVVRVARRVWAVQPDASG